MRITVHWAGGVALPSVAADIARAGGALAWAGFGCGERRIGVDVEDRAAFEALFRVTRAGEQVRGVSDGDVNAVSKNELELADLEELALRGEYDFKNIFAWA